MVEFRLVGRVADPDRPGHTVPIDEIVPRLCYMRYHYTPPGQDGLWCSEGSSAVALCAVCARPVCLDCGKLDAERRNRYCVDHVAALLEQG